MNVRSKAVNETLAADYYSKVYSYISYYTDNKRIKYSIALLIQCHILVPDAIGN